VVVDEVREVVVRDVDVVTAVTVVLVLVVDVSCITDVVPVERVQM